MATILVVDDEMGIRELLSEILNDEGHEVLLASNATQARTIYAERNIDLVLLDIWMPDTDGMSLLREWATNHQLRNPIVMMSGHATIDTALEAQTLGAAGFLEKPITLHKLLSTVQKLLHQWADHKQSRAQLKNSQELNTLNPIQDNKDRVIANNNDDKPLLFNPNQTNTFDKLCEAQEALQLTVNQASIDSNLSLIPLSSWHQTLSQITLDTTLREFREAVEYIYFDYILKRENASMTKVAQAAGLERTHLYRKLKQLNIDLPRKLKDADLNNDTV